MATWQVNNGSWRAEVWLDGRRHLLHGLFDTQAEAEHAAALAKINPPPPNAVPRKKWDRPMPTLREYLPAAVEMRQQVVDDATGYDYERMMHRHLLPVFGDWPLNQITTGALTRQFHAWMDAGLSKSTVKKIKTTISIGLQAAYEDDLIDRNPSRGIDLGRVPRKPIKIIDEQTFANIRKAMPTDGAEFWTSLAIATGARPNEIRALRPCDLQGRRLHLEWVVNEVRGYKKKGVPRFVRRYGTKNTETRVISLGHKAMAMWHNYVERHDIGFEDKLFPQRLFVPAITAAPLIDIPDDLPTFTMDGPRGGRHFRHGTIYAYTTGKCRCDWCQLASKQMTRTSTSYQSQKPKTPWRNPDEYVTHAQRSKMWAIACHLAGVTEKPNAYQLRHTHASWAIHNGESATKVMQRLGHKDLSVTKLYVQPFADDDAIADATDGWDIW